ncbi:hypothetical protein MTR67_015409 [Solanum verrucosum]|uniref:KIB1-4 beta-propeller domain-containing protein n=1 Tax=Solanum verrucosum TaxID=315347 RepID=A0AAF0QLD5_SOLVR|nr:hypothetical protein MTR67_015409 [Solanum verrucosum]
MILNKRIPKASRKRCLESMGWLITVGEEGEISLLHPFFDVHIELPHQNTTVEYTNHHINPLTCFTSKTVLSATPSHTSDYLLMVIDWNFRFLNFWKLGDIRWTRVTWEGNNHRIVCGAIDGTYIEGEVPKAVQQAYRNRKGGS